MNERLLKNAPLADGGNYESNTKQRWAPAITSYFNRETTMTDQVVAVAAAVSKTAPLFLLVMVFQRQIAGGLRTGAVKRLIPNEYLGDYLKDHQWVFIVELAQIQLSFSTGG